MRLTDRSVRSLKAKKNRRLRVFDSIAPGLVLQVTPAGAKSFYFVFREPKQRPQWLRLGDAPALSLADARDIANSERSILAAGKNPITERQKAIEAAAEAKRQEQSEKRFPDLARAFVDELRADGKTSWRNYWYVLVGGSAPDAKRTVSKKKPSVHAPFSELWADKKIKEITKADIAQEIKKIRRVKPVHANRVFSYLRQCFTFAIANDWLAENPCDRLHKHLHTKERKRRRYLEADELRTLWRALDNEPQLIADIVRVLAYTGQRSNEVFKMRWDELQGDWWILSAARTKNDTDHHVWVRPLEGILQRRREAQRQSKHAESPWVFRSPKRPNQAIAHINKAMIRLRAETGLRFTPHDLRRTCKTKLSELKVPKEIKDRVLNHISGRNEMDQRYDWYDYRAEVRAALERWARYLNAVVAGEPTTFGYWEADVQRATEELMAERGNNIVVFRAAQA